ncbi:hypothetical protein RFI_09761, partial [Reticulomyxa filosa]
MPHGAGGKVLKWINPGSKSQSGRDQYIATHGRWISRYSSARNALCEQRLDLTKIPIWIDSAELNRPVIVAIGPNNNDGMRLEFNGYDEAKKWTEKLRQNGQYYRALASTSSPEAPYPLIDKDLELDPHVIDKAKHLGWANKRKARLMVGWDHRYFMVWNGILYYFDKEPLKSITSPKTKSSSSSSSPSSPSSPSSGGKCVASGGFRISEIDVCVDELSERSGQEHCLLLYHFDRTIFIKFDERWPLLECYKAFHREMKYVDFSMSQLTFTTKPLNIDVLVAEEQHARIASRSPHSNH